MSGGYLAEHRCSAWCRPPENVHAIFGYGDLFTRAIESGHPIVTIWGQAVPMDSCPAEAPPNSLGQPAVIVIMRFLNGADPRVGSWGEVSTTWEPG